MHALTRSYQTAWFDYFFFFSSRRRHTRCSRDWSSDVCSSVLLGPPPSRQGGRSRTATLNAKRRTALSWVTPSAPYAFKNARSMACGAAGVVPCRGDLARSRTGHLKQRVREQPARKARKPMPRSSEPRRQNWSLSRGRHVTCEDI